MSETLRVPAGEGRAVLLGEGLSLFGATGHDVPLTHRSTRVLGAGFVQSTYVVTDSPMRERLA